MQVRLKCAKADIPSVQDHTGLNKWETICTGIYLIWNRLICAWSPPFFAPGRNSSSLGHSGWVLLQTHKVRLTLTPPTQEWGSQRAHYYGNSPQQSQAISTALPSQRSHVNPAPKRYEQIILQNLIISYMETIISISVAGHEHKFCHLAEVTVYPGVTYAVQVYTCRVCVTISCAPVLNKSHPRLGAPRWLSQLSVRLLILAQVVISELWNPALSWAPRSDGRLLKILSLSLCPSPHSFSLSQINKS